MSECLMFKELEIMKVTLRYLLMIVAMVSVLSLAAQQLAQQPQVQMRSTSVMAPSGSTLPQAAMTGTVTTYSIGSPAKSPKPRRAGENEGTEDEEDPDNPAEPFPMGDALWPLMLLAGAYLTIRVARRRVRKERQIN